MRSPKPNSCELSWTVVIEKSLLSPKSEPPAIRLYRTLFPISLRRWYFGLLPERVCDTLSSNTAVGIELYASQQAESLPCPYSSLPRPYIVSTRNLVDNTDLLLRRVACSIRENRRLISIMMQVWRRTYEYAHGNSMSGLLEARFCRATTWHRLLMP